MAETDSTREFEWRERLQRDDERIQRQRIAIALAASVRPRAAGNYLAWWPQ